MQLDDYDHEKVAEMILALLYLTLHDGNRAWKGIPWQAMNDLFESGYIEDPRNKTKSVVLTKHGLARSEELFRIHFGRDRV
jgi:hypothetical protein